MSTVFDIIKGLAVSLCELLPLSGNGFYQLLSLFKSTYTGTDAETWFIIFANLGAVAALVLIFKDDIIRLANSLWEIIKKLIKKENIQKGEAEQELLLYAMGAAPVLVWPLLRYVFGFMGGSNLLLTIAFVLSGVLLIGADRIKRTELPLIKIKASDSLISGIFRLLGFIPGLTGTGGMIFAGLLSGFSEKFVYKYAVIICIPVYFGKLLMNIFPALKVPLNLPDAIGCIITLAASFMASYHLAGIFEKMLSKRKLKVFSYILFAAAFVSLTLWMRG